MKPRFIGTLNNWKSREIIYCEGLTGDTLGLGKGVRSKVEFGGCELQRHLSGDIRKSVASTGLEFSNPRQILRQKFKLDGISETVAGDEREGAGMESDVEVSVIKREPRNVGGGGVGMLLGQ